MKRPFWHNWSIPEKWSDCLSYAMQIKFLAKWLGKVDERVDHLEAGGATVEVDSTVTGAAGTDAKVENVGTDTNAKLKFTIPRGAKGDNGRDGTDGENGVTPHFNIGDVITLLPSEQATASITGTDAEPVLNLGIPQGITGQAGQNGTNGTNGTNGEDGFSPIVATESISGGTRVIVTDKLGPHQFNVMNGADGVGIASVVFKETDAYGNNVYTITLTNGNQYDFTAPKGAKGDQGIPGSGEDGVGISSIVFDEELPSGNQYIVTLSNGQTYTFIAPKGSKGDTGNTGNTGPQGVGITSITFKEVDASGSNVYTVNLSNNTSYDFTAPKGNTGSAGADGDDGVGIVSVVYKETDISGNYIYTVNLSDNTSYDITCPKGDTGDTGATGEGVPTGGYAGEVLAKASDNDYVTYWKKINEVPSTGEAGQFLKRYGSDPDQVMFDDIAQVPDSSGASSGDVLTADGDGNYSWETPSGGGGSVTKFSGEVSIAGASDTSNYNEYGSVSLGGIDLSGKDVYGNLEVSIGNMTLYKTYGSNTLTGFGVAQMTQATKMITMKINTSSDYLSEDTALKIPVLLWDNTANKYLVGYINVSLNTKVSYGYLYVRVKITGSVLDTASLTNTYSVYFTIGGTSKVKINLFGV